MDSSLAHLISWSEPTKGDAPLALTGPSITISPLPPPHAPTVFLFGGKYVHNRKLTNEIWAMNLNTRIWEKIDAGPGPSPRYFHSMDVWENKLVCFGGMSDSEPTSVHNDIWFFDCSTRKWLPSDNGSTDGEQALVPMARYAHLSAISRGKLLVSGGQHSDNSWIYEINVYDLKKRRWISKTQQPEMNGQHSKGAYRSVATSSKQRVIIPPKRPDSNTSQSYSIDEEGEGGDIWCYSNYDFAKVRRELDIIAPSDDDDQSDAGPRFTSTPCFAIRDESTRMRGSAMPPGLRFPTGGIVGNHFILCGLYLASSSAAFSIWSLDLTTYIWRHIEPAVLNDGSWNRALVWPERARILVFGNTESDIATDYGKRAVSVDHMAVISLETYGIYRPPRLEIPVNIQQRGLMVLDENLASDFAVIAEDGRRVKCSRHVLRERWAWFAAQEKDLVTAMAGEVKDAPAVDVADTLMGSFEPTKIAATSVTLHEPFPVCVALVQYFYTQSLSTPLQNRAPILSALLFLSKQYKIDRLAKLVVHALHERLEPNVAVGVYEISTLSGEQALQIRALNMIHSSKGSGTRSHRAKPSGGQGSDGGTSAQSPARGPNKSLGFPPPPPSGSEGGGAGHGIDPSPRRSENDTQRRARVESMTLEDPAEMEADQLLNALQSPLELHDDPRDALVPRRPTRRVHTRLALTDSSDELPRLPIARSPSMSSDHRSLSPSTILPYLSPTDTPQSVDSASSIGPMTPMTTAESLRQSVDAMSISSRGTSANGQLYGLGLPPIPQEPTEYTWTFRDGASDQGKQPPAMRSATVTRGASLSRPPAALSGIQAQYLGRRPDHAAKVIDRGSTDDQSLFSQSDTGMSTDGIPTTPSTPVSWADGMTVHLDGSVKDSKYSSLLSETASVSSGSTGVTWNSDKRAMKEEKKRTQATEKAARKAERQATFEALQKQQAAERAETQRKAEAARLDADRKTKAEPKSKLGKFGKKFTNAVLFPEGGSNSNYF